MVGARRGIRKEGMGVDLIKIPYMHGQIIN